MNAPTEATGLIAAAITPLNEDQSLALERIPDLCDWLLSRHIQGFYVCGSTGEGVSLSSSERRDVAEAYVRAVDGRVPVFIQVGHNSLKESRQLAEHAMQCGASAISATCPSYFKVDSEELLVDCMAEISSAAELPFFYYHIPALTGNRLSMTKFLTLGSERLPNLRGLKFTTPELHEFQQCSDLPIPDFQVFWGTDEMLLAALATGAKAAIGSTYNFASPVYQRIIDTFQAGDISEARALQAQLVQIIATLLKFPFHGALKELMRWHGFDLGPSRLPLRTLEPQQQTALHKELEAIGYFELVGTR